MIDIAGEIDKINEDKIELKKEMDISRVNVLCRKIYNYKEYVQFLNRLYIIPWVGGVDIPWVWGSIYHW